MAILSNKKYIKIFFIVYLFKLIIFAFFINPLWSAPDEIGHFSYIEELSETSKVPILGKSKMSTNLFDNQKFDKEISLNYIAQHPPLYYFLSVPLYKFGKMLFNMDNERAFPIRIGSIILSLSTLICIFHIIKTSTSNEYQNIAVIIFISTIPSFTILSSTISSDIALVFFVTFASYYWIVAIKNQDNKSSHICAFILSLAILTKIPGLIFSFIMMSILVLDKIKYMSIKKWIINTISLLFTTLFLPSFWFLHQFSYHGIVAPIAGSGKYSNLIGTQLEVPLTDKFFYYIFNTDALGVFFKTFFILSSPHDSNNKPVVYIGNGEVEILFIVISCILLFVLFFASTSNFNKKLIYFYLFYIILIITILLIYNENHFIYKETFLVISLFSFFLVIITSLTIKIHPHVNILKLYSFIVIILISTIFVYFSYSFYLKYGIPRATQGRYLFPLLGFAAFIFTCDHKKNDLIYFLLASSGVLLEVYSYFAILSPQYSFLKI